MGGPSGPMLSARIAAT
ncbi:DUF6053 domain-containing protein [Lysobacter enzymogenes]